MKKIMVVLAAMMMVIAMVGGAFAATKTGPDVTVNAVLGSNCKAGTAGVLDFTLDPAVANATAAQTTDATVFCSNGTPFTITASSSGNGTPAAVSCSGAGITGVLKSSGVGAATPITYTFTCDVESTGTNGSTGDGLGTGKDIKLGIGATATANNNYENAVPDTYKDTVYLTINY